jgi:hypothetical protein
VRERERERERGTLSSAKTSADGTPSVMYKSMIWNRRIKEEETFR